MDIFVLGLGVGTHGVGGIDSSENVHMATVPSIFYFPGGIPGPGVSRWKVSA